ncbi:MAG: hypothetical protein ACTSU2_01770 [Promethearchaeota archaeon]
MSSIENSNNSQISDVIKERSEQISKKELILNSILLIFAFYQVSFQFITNLLLQQYGVLFAFTSFFWLFWSAILALIIIFVAKPRNSLTLLMKPFVLIVMGYLYSRYLLEDYFAISPGVYIFNWVIIGMMLIVFLESLGGLIKLFLTSPLKQIKASFKSKGFRVVSVLAIIWLSLISLSYFGFFQKYQVVDPHQENFKISFWGAPMGGLTYANYADGSHDEELNIYKNMSSSFYIGVSNYTFSSEHQMYLSNLSAVLSYFSAFNVHIIFNLNPYIAGYNGCDFVTYWYADEVNATLQALMSWMSTLNSSSLSAIRGISLDVEGPNYKGTSPSVEQYEKGIVQYQTLFDEFKSRFPGKEVLLIDLDTMIFDNLDGDQDLNIQHQTFCDPPNWDYYGFMTYMTGSASISTSSYNFAYYLNIGKEEWGIKFQPWIGWLYNPKDENDPNVIENPVVYNHFMEQVKIAKSTGVEEIVIAPVRNFYGRNHTEGLQRVYDLYEIYKGFDSFEIPIYQNMRLFHDQHEYFKHFNPFYFYSSTAIFRDLITNMRNGPVLWFEVFQLMFVVLGYLGYRYKIIQIDTRSLKDLLRKGESP